MKKLFFVQLFVFVLVFSGDLFPENLSQSVSPQLTGSIVKVVRKESAFQDLGRPRNSLGYPALYFDKFYSSQVPLSSSEAGEYHVIEWKCAGVPETGETFRLQFQYMVENETELKRKDLDIPVERDGFYETEVEHKGESFLKEGRIQAWKVDLYYKERLLDTQTSTFWTESPK